MQANSNSGIKDDYRILSEQQIMDLIHVNTSSSIRVRDDASRSQSERSRDTHPREAKRIKIEDKLRQQAEEAAAKEHEKAQRQERLRLEKLEKQLKEEVSFSVIK